MFPRPKVNSILYSDSFFKVAALLWLQSGSGFARLNQAMNEIFDLFIKTGLSDRWKIFISYFQLQVSFSLPR